MTLHSSEDKKVKEPTIRHINKKKEQPPKWLPLTL